MGDWILPLVVIFILTDALLHKTDVFSCFLEGASEGLNTAAVVLPALVALMVAVGVLSVSGALETLSHLLAPIGSLLGMPQELMPLALIRPLSGSGSLSIFSELLSRHGADSLIGQIASVMQGSSETTFYTIAVYYGAVGIQKPRHTLFAALIADLVGYIMSAQIVRYIVLNLQG